MSDEIRFCKECGSKLPDGSNFCTQCGTQMKDNQVPTAEVEPALELPKEAYSSNETLQGEAMNDIPEEPRREDIFAPYEPSSNTSDYQQTSSVKVNKKAFMKTLALPSTKAAVITAAILSICLGALNLINIMTLGLISAIDVLVFAGCGVFILLKQSRAAAIVSAAWYIIGQGFYIIAGGSTTAQAIFAIVIMACLIWGAVATFNLNKEYKAYLNEY